MTELTVADFVVAHVGGARRVLDCRDDGRDLAGELDLPAGVAFERGDPAGPPARLDSDVLLVIRASVEPARGWDPAPMTALVQAVESGSRLVILLDDPVSLTGLDLLGEVLVAGQVGILAAARVSDAEVRAALAGRHSDQAPDEIRVANRGRLLALLPDGPGPDSPDDPRESASAREIRRLRRQAQADQARIAELETSAYYRIGKAAVGAMRQPRRIASLVPRARRAWTRQSKAPARRPVRGRSRDEALAAWYDSLGQEPQQLFLAYTAAGGGPRTGLVIAAIIRDGTAGALGSDAQIHQLGPNDALLGLERADPDLVLVETGAFSAGLPWAYVGSAAAVDRDRILAAVLDEARRLGRPSVLWHSPAVPSPVGIQPFHRRFDLVLGDAGQPAELAGWHPGVQLSTFNSHQLDPGRAGLPVFVGAWDPRAPLARRDLMERLLTAAAGCGPNGRAGAVGRDGASGLEIRFDSRAINGADGFPAALRSSLAGSIDPAVTAGLYRSRPLVIADGLAGIDGLHRALEALACGCRVVSLPDDRLAEIPGASIRLAAPDRDLAGLMAEAGTLEPLDETAIRPVSRRIFQAHASPVALGTLTRRLGLGTDPTAHRSISVIVPSSAGTLAIVDSLKRQTLPPHEVVLELASGEPQPAAVVEELNSLVMPARMVSVPSNGWADLAAAAGSSWVFAWPGAGLDDPNALLDLALAAEASRADAVGLVADAPGTGGGAASGGFVADLPVEGSLISRELATRLVAGDRLGLAARRGARLFATPAVPDRTGR
jgi:hypothetical protein